MDYKNVFNYNPIPNWIYEISTLQILDVNESAINHYGYSRLEFLSMSFLDTFPSAEIPNYAPTFQKLEDKSGNINFGVFTHAKKNSDTIRVEISGHKVDFHGKKCVLLNCQDVTLQEKQLNFCQEAQNIMDASLDVICSIDEDGKFIRVSAASKAHWGYTPEELKGKVYIELVHELDIDKTQQAALDCIAGSNFTTFENRYIKKDGQIAYNLWSAYWDPVAKIMYTVARNGEDKLIKEQFLLESESRFKVLVQDGSDLIAILDILGNYKYVSPTSKNILGIDPEEFIGKNSFQFIHPEDVEKIKQSLTDIETQQRVVVSPFRFKNGVGDWRWVETVFTNMLVHPSIQGIVANSRDITALKEEEERLKLLESVVINTSDAVVITEAEPQSEPGPRILYVNEAFTEMTGYEPSEVIGKSPRILQGPKSDMAELSRLSEAMRNWKPCEITTVNYKKNGQEFWINIKISPVANEKGLYTHWIAIERDVTEAKNEEIQKELLSKISKVFNNGVDLKNSLGELCKLLVDYWDFSFCEIWLPTLHKKSLRLASHCYLNVETKEFYTGANVIDEMDFGSGLPGNVWNEKKTILWDDLSLNTSFLRKEAAQKIGLNTVIGLPLKNNDDIVGVLVVGSSEKSIKIKHYSPILMKLKLFIGSEINRKRLEGDLYHLFEALPDLICLTDFDGNFLKINQAGCDILGYEEEEIIGKNFSNFLHPDDKILTNQKVRELAHGESVQKFENRYLSKSGQIVWLSWNSNSNLTDCVIYASAKDITEEYKLKALVQDASGLALIGGWEIDVINDKLTWSDMVHQIHETNPENFTPKVSTAIHFYKDDYKEIVASFVQNASETGEPFDFKAPVISAKGNEKWVRAIGQAEIVDGKCIRIYGSFQDITSVKNTQNRLETITNDLPGVMFQYHIYPDITDKLLTVSQASWKLWGFSPEQCESDSNLVWDQIKRGGDFEEVSNNIQNSIKNKSRLHARYRIIKENGEIRFHEAFGSPHFLPDGSVIFNTMVFDITEEKKAISLNELSAKLAVIGSWELNLKNQSNDAMYWSPVLRQIMEVDESYSPSLTGGFEFYEQESREKIETAVKQLIENKVPFDEELCIKSGKGNYRWIRCIGNGDFYQDECIRIFGSYQDINERKLIAENLKKAYIEKNQIIESIGDAFYTMNRNFEVTYWNVMAEKLLGVNREQIIGKTLWEVFPDTVDLPSYKFYNQAMTDGEPVKFEDYYGLWLEVDVYPSEEGLTVFFRDITLRKESDTMLKKAYEERNQILESIGDAFFAVDDNWIVTYWNRMAQEVMSKAKEEIIGKNLWEEYADAIDTEFYKNYHLAKDTGKVITFEDNYMALNKWFEVTVYPSENGLSVYFKDITSRKESDYKIREANQRFEKVAEATADAIWDWDIRNDCFYRGKGFENIFGSTYAHEMKESDLWKERFHQEDLATLKSSIHEAILDPSTTHWGMEYRVHHVSGKIKTVLDKGIIIRNPEGIATRMVGALTDITFRKEHELELKSLNADLTKNIYELQLANEELEQFAFIASHDLQEPLRMVTSFLDQLNRKYSDKLDDKGNQYIFFAVDGANRMKKIILDLLDYSRAGRFHESTEQINLTEFIEDYKSLRRKVIDEKSVEIITQNLPLVKAHMAPMTQTLHSILDNAIKYSKADVSPKIELTVLEEPKQWVFSIKDNGIGIDNRFFDKIFIIFQRLHNRDQYEGTGIGLSIVKKHVESWGGKVWVESQLGKGSTFFFSVNK